MTAATETTRTFAESVRAREALDAVVRERVEILSRGLDGLRRWRAAGAATAAASRARRHDGARPGSRLVDVVGARMAPRAHRPATREVDVAAVRRRSAWWRESAQNRRSARHNRRRSTDAEHDST